MNKARWQYIKSLSPPPPRYAHVSAVAYMVKKPLDAAAAVTMPLLPYVQKPGETFCENRSARKQANRENKARAAA